MRHTFETNSQGWADNGETADYPRTDAREGLGYSQHKNSGVVMAPLTGYGYTSLDRLGKVTWQIVGLHF